MKLLYFGFIFILIAGCVPQQAEVRTLNQGELESTTGTETEIPSTPTELELDSNFNYDLKWNNAGLASEVLTISPLTSNTSITICTNYMSVNYTSITR